MVRVAYGATRCLLSSVCKRYLGTVRASAFGDFCGAMVGRSDKGLIITTGSFSNDAKREATRDGAPAIDLIDGDHLCDLLRSLKLGVGVEFVERIVVDTDWFARVGGPIGPSVTPQPN